MHRLISVFFTLPLLLISCAPMPLDPQALTWHLHPGRIEPFSFAPFRNGKQCWVYLPPGYASSGNRYPVLYLNDGDLAFDSRYGMHVNRICETLIRSGEIEPLIVVAVGTTDAERTFDYTPWPDEYSPFIPNGGGRAYVEALCDTLKPEIDRRYRTLSDRSHTAIAGMSLGGLLSLYAAVARESVFSRVAAFSPYYNYGACSICQLLIETRWPTLAPTRFYQDTGFPDDNYIDDIEDIAIARGFKLGLNFMSFRERNGTHDTVSWQRRFPGMLRFLFPPINNSVASPLASRLGQSDKLALRHETRSAHSTKVDTR